MTHPNDQVTHSGDIAYKALGGAFLGLCQNCPQFRSKELKLIIYLNKNLSTHRF